MAILNNEISKTEALTTSNLEESKPMIENSKLKFDLLAFSTFLAIGTVQLIGWNSLLNATTSMMSSRFPEVVGDILTTVAAAYSTVIVIITILLLKFAKLNISTTYCGLALSGIVGLAFAFVMQFANNSSVSPLLHIIGGLMALSSAFIGSSAFAFAAIFPTDYSGAMSAGLGVSGVVTFSVWMVSAFAIFGESPGGIARAVWVLTAVTVIVSALAVILLQTLFQRPWVKEILHQRDSEGKVDDEETQKAEVGTFELGGLSLVLRTIAGLTLSYLFHMMVTLTCFPALGPLAWKEDAKWKTDFLTGIFQVFDLIGRYIPNFIPILRVKPRTAKIFIFGRLLFLVTFIFSFKLRDTFIFGEFWFKVIQMGLLAITNGWLCTVCFMRIPELVKGSEAKSKAGIAALLSTFIGIAIGQWIGYGLQKI